MKRFLKRLLRDTRGNILVIGAAGSFALCGGAGLAVDAVNWYLWKRQLQQAVDSGSLAGAYALSQGMEVESSATADLEKNSPAGVVIERIANPPSSGAYSGDTRAVEIIATTSHALPFSSLFLASPPVIRARSVSASVAEGEHCIISLAGDGIGVNVAGSADINLGCGVAANSAGSHAIYLEGSSWLNASPLSSVGGIASGSTNTPASTNRHPYGPIQSDPLAPRNLQVPQEPASCSASNFEAPPNRTTTLVPGRYCDGLSLKGDALMQPGVYVIDRGTFYIASQASVTGDGVTIILTGDGPSNIAITDIAGGANITMRAPTELEDPLWKNILFFQDPRGSSSISKMAGGSLFHMEGFVYMPRGEVQFAGSSGQHAECLLMVARRVMLAGVTSLDNTCPADYDDLDTSSRRIRVVE